MPLEIQQSRGVVEPAARDYCSHHQMGRLPSQPDRAVRRLSNLRQKKSQQRRQAPKRNLLQSSQFIRDPSGPDREPRILSRCVDQRLRIRPNAVVQINGAWVRWRRCQIFSAPAQLARSVDTDAMDCFTECGQDSTNFTTWLVAERRVEDASDAAYEAQMAEMRFLSEPRDVFTNVAQHLQLMASQHVRRKLRRSATPNSNKRHDIHIPGHIESECDV